ncbi:MAG: hypothetical protein WDN29_10785 [Methylovirgula sp.]
MEGAIMVEVTTEKLLYTRKDAKLALGGRSTATMLRMEAEGLLKPIKLSSSPNGQTFYTKQNILEVAQCAVPRERLRQK